MIAKFKPDKTKYVLLSDEELDRRFECSKKNLSFTFQSFFFFLTEATDDYLVWEGEVYVKNEFALTQTKTELELKS